MRCGGDGALGDTLDLLRDLHEEKDVRVRLRTRFGVRKRLTARAQYYDHLWTSAPQKALRTGLLQDEHADQRQQQEPRPTRFQRHLYEQQRRQQHFQQALSASSSSASSSSASSSPSSSSASSRASTASSRGGRTPSPPASRPGGTDSNADVEINDGDNGGGVAESAFAAAGAHRHHINKRRRTRQGAAGSGRAAPTRHRRLRVATTSFQRMCDARDRDLDARTRRVRKGAKNKNFPVCGTALPLSDYRLAVQIDALENLNDETKVQLMQTLSMMARCS